MGRELFELAALLVGVALVALLVGHANQTATVVNAVSSGFGRLLATTELAGGYAGDSGIASAYTSFAGPFNYGQ